MADLTQLETALRNADAAGDVQAATMLAGEISRMRSTPVMEDVAKSAGAGLGQGVIGLAGTFGDIPDLLAKGTNYLGNKVGEKLGFEPYKLPEKSQTLNQYVPTSQDIQGAVEKNVTGEFYKPQTTAGKYARAGAEFIPGAMLGPGGIATKTISGIGAGLGSEAAGQASAGSGYEPIARVLGGVGGGLSPSVLSRAVTPVPSNANRQRLVDILQGEGVDSLTAGQRTGNKALQYAESTFGELPGAGQGPARIQQEGQRQFTEAATRRAGIAGDAGPESLGNNYDRLGNEFRTLSNRNNLRFDQQFGADAGAAVANYQRVPPSQQRAMVEGYVQDIVDHMQTGTMPGPFYQEMRSRLSRQANSLRQSDPTLSDTLRGLRNALDDAMGRSIPAADQEAWQTARQQYGAQKVLEKAASRAGESTAEGNIVPANLRNAVAAENRGAYARGQGDFSELARAGSGVMAPLPNSGTGQRVNTMDMLNFATLGLAKPALGASIGRVLMSQPMQSYLANQLMTGRMNNPSPGQMAIIRSLLGQERPQSLEGPR